MAVDGRSCSDGKRKVIGDVEVLVGKGLGLMEIGRVWQDWCMSRHVRRVTVEAGGLSPSEISLFSSSWGKDLGVT